jgi:hypothetical protein
MTVGRAFGFSCERSREKPTEVKFASCRKDQISAKDTAARV